MQPLFFLLLNNNMWQRYGEPTFAFSAVGGKVLQKYYTWSVLDQFILPF